MTGLGAMMAGGNPDEERGRQKDDFYSTPLEVTQALMHYLCRVDTTLLGRPTGIWEPCAGDLKMSIPIAVWLHNRANRSFRQFPWLDVVSQDAARRMREGLS